MSLQSLADNMLSVKSITTDTRRRSCDVGRSTPGVYEHAWELRTEDLHSLF